MNYKISELLEKQKNLQIEYKKLENNNHNLISFEENSIIDSNKVKDGILLMVRECMEVLDEINYKSHILEKKELNFDNILIEMIDVLKFWLNIILYFGFTSEQISNAFDRKSIINYQKIQEQLKKINNENTN